MNVSNTDKFQLFVAVYIVVHDLRGLTFVTQADCTLQYVDHPKGAVIVPKTLLGPFKHGSTILYDAPNLLKF